MKQGEVIAYVGDTGNAGPGNYHLHFSIAARFRSKTLLGRHKHQSVPTATRPDAITVLSFANRAENPCNPCVIAGTPIAPHTQSEELKMTIIRRFFILSSVRDFAHGLCIGATQFKHYGVNAAEPVSDRVAITSKHRYGVGPRDAAATRCAVN